MSDMLWIYACAICHFAAEGPAVKAVEVLHSDRIRVVQAETQGRQ